jgi:branched-chain amino acid transport system ATP-binding protein
MFNGEDITGMPPHVIARKGIGLAPDYRGVFVDLTVEENILMPKWIVGSKTLKEREDKNFEDVIYKIFPELEAMRNRKGLLLSGGEGKMLAIARALMLRPRLLLLDAPLEGLAPVAVNRIAEGLKNIQGYGVSMLVAECNIDLATRLSKEIYVIERGEIVYGGDAGEFLRQKELIKLVRGY